MSDFEHTRHIPHRDHLPLLCDRVRADGAHRAAQIVVHRARDVQAHNGVHLRGVDFGDCAVHHVRALPSSAQGKILGAELEIRTSMSEGG